MKWIYLHLPFLYLEYHYRHLSPEHPLALRAERGSHLLLANPAAIAAGIEPGMLANTAYCLCPRLSIDTYHPHKAEQALQYMARHLDDCSAHISLDPPDGLYLEVASMRRLFGSLREIRRQITERLQAGGFHHSMAASPLAAASRLLARSGVSRWVDTRRLQMQLNSLPVESLQLKPVTLTRLYKLGIRTVGGLLQLPPRDLAYRIDNDLATEVRRITGLERWEPPHHPLPPRFEWGSDLEQSFDTLIPMRFAMTQGLRTLCQFMQARCLLCREVLLHLRTTEGQEQTVSLKLAVPDDRLESWVYRLNLCIERTRLTAPVTGFRLEADQFSPLENQSRQLFGEPGQPMQDRGLLINRLAARIGMEQLSFLNLTEDVRPERQTERNGQPLAVPHRHSARASLRYDASLNDNIARLSAGSLLDQPLWLLPDPVPIDIHNYTLIRGPTRVSSGWWDNHVVHRDYYLASRAGKALHWIYQNASRRWFWHGIFA